MRSAWRRASGFSKDTPVKPHKILPVEGDTFEVPHPFCRDTYSCYDGDGSSSIPTWKPGVRNEYVLPDDSECVADAMGAQLITVLGTYRPGNFPMRVFFTRQWRDPDGKVFGKRKCHSKTLGMFRSMVRGYRVDFRLIGQPTREAMLAAQYEEMGRIEEEATA